MTSRKQALAPGNFELRIAVVSAGGGGVVCARCFVTDSATVVAPSKIEEA